MTNEGDAVAILRALGLVQNLRAARLADSTHGERVMALKRFQHARFERTYDDLLHSKGQCEAARFFLNELYGPHDFSDRDDQFARIVPALVRLFPREIVATVRQLAELHALSEELDDAMATVLGKSPSASDVDLQNYASAWREVGRPEARDRQIALMLDVGRSLMRYTRNPLLRQGLKMMRAPAKTAGLGALQGFLERGFETFRRLDSPAAFLETIATRESAMSHWLFFGDRVGDPPPFASSSVN